MNRFVTTMVCSAALLTGAQAFAAEPIASNSKNNTATEKMTPDQMAKHDTAMKDCVTQQKAMNSTMSAAEVDTTCKAQLKAKRDSMKMDGMKHDGMPHGESAGKGTMNKEDGVAK